ncbi:MAG: mycofactocin-coupled SDR family oxidoreductase [Actinomycetaceae bacterium]
MAGRLEGKVAFITGAARGQGRNHAIRLAQEGADIIAVDVSQQVDTVPYDTARAEDLAETVRQVEALDRRIVAREADVRDLAALTAVADEGVAELGRLDIILANAGINTMSPTLEMDEHVWQTMIDVNLTGVWKTVRAAAHHIVDGGNGGSIVITSSLASMKTNANIAHYTAAKAGVVGLMRVLAKELAPHSIRVNTIHPTTLASPMILNDPTYQLFRPDLENPTREDFDEAALQMNVMPVVALEPDDTSEAILYLVSDSGRYITGIEHALDAGARLG